MVLFSRSCLLVSHTRRGNPLLVFPNGGMSEKLRGYFCLILSLGNPKRKKKKRIDRRLEKRDIFRLEVNQEHMKARPKSFSEQIAEKTRPGRGINGRTSRQEITVGGQNVRRARTSRENSKVGAVVNCACE